MSLDYAQLQLAITAAKRQFSLIQAKYPAIKAYLVLSLPSGQTGIDSGPLQILAEFPGMVIGDAVKTTALDLQARIKAMEWRGTAGPEVEQLRKELERITWQFNYEETCQVEMRFHELQFDLIWALQADELVDLQLTPQTKASIRIVLGTLASFAGARGKGA